MNRYRTLLIVLYLAVFTPHTAAADTVFESSPYKTSVVELFTSEGCSSCPPADQWLGNMRKSSSLWKKVVPVGFHVGYWDYLGWKDRFAQKVHTNRQHRYVRLWGKDSAYTPGIVLNGTEWREWRHAREIPVESDKKPGVLRVESVGGDKYRVRFTPLTAEQENWEVSAFLLGFDISSQVRAGENGGKTLKHEFVALTQDKQGMNSLHKSFVAIVTLPVPADIETEKKGIAVWVTRPNGIVPVQATGGYLN